jgi:acetyl esterase/lipase
MPLLVGQGAADPLVLPDVQATFVRGLCAAGATVDYRTYPDKDHVGVVTADSPLIPDLVAWTQDRLSGNPPPTTC